MHDNILREMGFAKEVKRRLNRQCPICGLPIRFGEFKDELSKREYGISGLCQTCQDKVFR